MTKDLDQFLKQYCPDSYPFYRLQLRRERLKRWHKKVNDMLVPIAVIAAFLVFIYR